MIKGPHSTSYLFSSLIDVIISPINWIKLFSFYRSCTHTYASKSPLAMLETTCSVSFTISCLRPVKRRQEMQTLQKPSLHVPQLVAILTRDFKAEIRLPCGHFWRKKYTSILKSVEHLSSLFVWQYIPPSNLCVFFCKISFCLWMLTINFSKRKKPLLLYKHKPKMFTHWNYDILFKIDSYQTSALKLF